MRNIVLGVRSMFLVSSRETHASCVRVGRFINYAISLVLTFYVCSAADSIPEHQ